MWRWTRTRFLATLLGALLTAGTGTAAAETNNRLITIGTAGKGGVYYLAGGAICRQVNENRSLHGIRCITKSTKGSVANLKAVRSGKLDIAVVQSDWHYHAYNGSEVFEPTGANSDLRSLFSLHAEPFTIVARREAGISSVADLKGKRVDVGIRGSGNRATAETVLMTEGLNVDDLALMTEFDANEQARALCGGELEAVIAVVGHPNRGIQEMARSCDVTLAAVSGPAIDRMVAANPYYWHTTIPGNMYAGISQATETFGLGATVVDSVHTDPDVVYDVVKAVFGDFDTFKKRHPAFASLGKKQMIENGLTAPLHIGALRYYREAGLK